MELLKRPDRCQAPQTAHDRPDTRPLVVRVLLDPQTYPETDRPAHVRMIETHVSWLFFTRAFVYKVKKPVDFAFLNFTTLEQRHHFCLEELRLNRRLSPDVYMDVVAVCRVGNRHTLDESVGEVIDYAVKLRRLPDTRWLSCLLDRGEATPAMIKRIARLIARFHAKAAPARGVGGIATVELNTRENFAQTWSQVGTTLSPEAFDRIRVYTQEFLAGNRALFAQRARNGRLKECHGDLHADQISVADNIAFIDCIEFNERFRYSDVAADVAFLTMDLEYRHRPDLAKTFVRTYIQATADRELASVLDFYKCYRAYSRGKVLGFRLEERGLRDEERRAITEQASGYFALAASYAQLRGPALVVLSGLMGSGKSTLARALAPRLDARLFVSDVERKALAGLPIGERRVERFRGGIYSPEMSDRTYAELHRRARLGLERGEIIILDASYGDLRHRADARALARATGARFALLEAVCPDVIIRARLRDRGPGPSDGRADLLDLQRKHFHRPLELPPRQHLKIDTSGPPENVVLTALAALYRNWLGVTS